MRPRPDDPEEEWFEGLKIPARRKYAKRPLSGRARVLSAAEGNAVVAEIYPNQAAVRPVSAAAGGGTVAAAG